MRLGRQIEFTSKLASSENALTWDYYGLPCRYIKRTPDSQGGVPGVYFHGFGASSKQWCNFNPSTTSYYPDLLGFGRSPKPAITYTQYLWEDFGSLFVSNVAMKGKGKDGGYVLGGNSIGGYVAMGVAAAAGKVKKQTGCKGLVLFNTAGRVISREDVSNERLKMKGRSVETMMKDGSFEAKVPGRLQEIITLLFSKVLINGLRTRVRGICVNLYPSNETRVNDNLVNDIVRDSLDEGAEYVMVSGAKLPPPRTANELLGADFGDDGGEGEDKYMGNVLVVQGTSDPLNDAKGRMENLGELREGITVREIVGGGHCPHDERGEECGVIVEEWMKELNLM
ncbi:hypothetical protein TrCOL_g12253 [Triparma columacea]|uniref:AB hydrolase-1 domain-containing protein n=1 Tax=Triparma columacea TaxID=722753 RepID=A0A9W7L3A5_9STRA|nr:hypothetical protein TrCOL_g12253 [Triparma columacea]